MRRGKNWAFTNGLGDKSTGQFYKKGASSFPEGESLWASGAWGHQLVSLPHPGSCHLPRFLALSASLLRWLIGHSKSKLINGASWGMGLICLLRKPVVGLCTGIPDLEHQETLKSELRMILLENLRRHSNGWGKRHTEGGGSGHGAGDCCQGVLCCWMPRLCLIP